MGGWHHLWVLYRVSAYLGAYHDFELIVQVINFLGENSMTANLKGMFAKMMHRPEFRQFFFVFMLAMMFIVSAMPAAAQELELDITGSLDAVIQSINSFLPLAMEILGFAGGIAIAFAIGTFVVNSLLKAFRGGSI